MVPALSCAAVAAGADGLLVEVHPCPAEAWCDADQALTPEEFAALMSRLGLVAQAVGRSLDQRPVDGTCHPVRMVQPDGGRADAWRGD
jgi:3-deoxy-D-manno-octulosonic acid (KDO) 8-phosphate synthase